MTDQRRLLGIFAHPDDESFGPGGTLALYGARGIDVHVCTVTDGAAGSDASPAAGPLALRRRQELECACEALGATLHMLDYRDSGMEGSADNKHPGSLYQADLECVALDIARIICRIRPEVILTHDPTGGYFHPDHIRVNHGVTSALVQLAEWQKGVQSPLSDALSREGLQAWVPSRVFHSVIPRSSLKWLVRFLRLIGRDPQHFGANHDIDISQVGVPDEQITLRLDVRPYLDVKERASVCHASQGGGGGPRGMPSFLQRFIFRYEQYVQAWPPDQAHAADMFPE
jgi:LmbE family N-acetylglucosaminyl deacetylase